jgi:hypothetical protein
MRKLFVLLGAILAFSACTNPTPENYFDKAVLNANIVNDFGSERLTKMLISYGVKHEGTAPDMKNPAETFIDSKVQYITKQLKDIKDLKETDETKNMLNTSVAMFEYVLPVYKNEYMALAKLSDEGGTQDDILSLGKEIDVKYGARFDSLYEVLTAEGKKYAAAHNINVNWGN